MGITGIVVQVTGQATPTSITGYIQPVPGLLLAQMATCAQLAQQ
jgi:hypothetical protein